MNKTHYKPCNSWNLELDVSEALASEACMRYSHKLRRFNPLRQLGEWSYASGHCHRGLRLRDLFIHR